MRVTDAIGQADRIKPNAFSTADKLGWLGELEGKIALELMRMSAPDAAQVIPTDPEHLERELLAAPPYDGIYTAWLIARIDEANGEYNRGRNTMALFNERYQEFANWFLTLYDPAQGYRCRDEWDD